MDEKTGHDISSFQTAIRDLEEKSNDIISSMTAVISGAKSILEKIENKKKSENEDINSKLSCFAKNAIQDSEGPLKPDELIQFLMNDVFDKQYKGILAIIRKYTDDIDGVRVQLSDVLEKHIEYRKPQKSLDEKFIKIIKKLNKTISDEQASEMLANKKQSTMGQFFHPKKRKSPNVSGNTSGTINGENQATSKTNKRLKQNSLENNTEVKHPIQSTSAMESDRSSERTETKNQYVSSATKYVVQNYFQ